MLEDAEEKNKKGKETKERQGGRRVAISNRVARQGVARRRPFESR